MKHPHHFIITIHNPGDLLNDVLEGVIKNSSPESVIIPVLDGCTDESDKIVEKHVSQKLADIRPITSPDLHEIGAINTALPILPEGHVFILQDDIILTERNIIDFFENAVLKKHDHVGFVSMRMGGNIIRTTKMKLILQMFRSRFKIRQRMIDFGNLTHSPFDTHTDTSKEQIKPWEIMEVQAAVKSPVWISSNLRQKVKLLDEKLMPFCYDDLDLSIESLKAGFKNYIAAFPYQSKKEWGGTRKKGSTFSKHVASIACRNRAYLFDKHYDWISSPGNSHIEKIFRR